MATKKITMQAIKVLHTTQVNCISCDECLDSEALALFHPSQYENIFGEKKKDTAQSKQRLSVVKITNGERTIYRQYAGRGIEGLDAEKIGLSPNAWQQLCLDNSANEVSITKGCLFPFYWYHSTLQHAYHLEWE